MVRAKYDYRGVGKTVRLSLDDQSVPALDGLRLASSGSV